MSLDPDQTVLHTPIGAGEMAPWIRALPALPEAPGLILTTHMEAHNHL